MSSSAKKILLILIFIRSNSQLLSSKANDFDKVMTEYYVFIQFPISFAPHLNKTFKDITVNGVRDIKLRQYDSFCYIFIWLR